MATRSANGHEARRRLKSKFPIQSDTIMYPNDRVSTEYIMGSVFVFFCDLKKNMFSFDELSSHCDHSIIKIILIYLAILM